MAFYPVCPPKFAQVHSLSDNGRQLSLANLFFFFLSFYLQLSTYLPFHFPRSGRIGGSGHLLYPALEYFLIVLA